MAIAGDCVEIVEKMTPLDLQIRASVDNLVDNLNVSIAPVRMK
jgi:hypothetical protein